MIELETARPGDVLMILDALLQMLPKSPAPQMKMAEPLVAHQSLMLAQRQQRLYIFGDFAILVDEGSPWYTSKRVLFEEIIIRWRRVHGNTVDSAIAQLEAIAKLHGCVAIGAGDTQIGYMTPRYLAAGYTTLGIQFHKEIPNHGDTTQDHRSPGPDR
jgi:hypothetical protein